MRLPQFSSYVYQYIQFLALNYPDSYEILLPNLIECNGLASIDFRQLPVSLIGLEILQEPCDN